MISNVSQLQDMSLDLSAYYKLANDIDATSTKGWNGGNGFVPVGDQMQPFRGGLDGDGFSIEHLWMARSQLYLGMFGSVDSAVLRNITLDDAQLTGGGSSVGILCGAARASTIEGCSVAGSINAASLTNSGGSIGHVRDGATTVSNCTSEVSVQVTLSASSIGGLIGWNQGGIVVDCISLGPLGFTVTDDTYKAGGLIGFNEGTVLRSVSKGTVTITAATEVDMYYLGGLIGHNTGSVSDSSSIERSVTRKNVLTLKGWGYIDHIGGLNGFDQGSVWNCLSRTDIRIESAKETGGVYRLSNLGGLIGYCSGTVELQNCSWAGSINVIYSTTKPISMSSVGGLIGYSTRKISVSWASGYMLLNGDVSNIGGLIGQTKGIVTSSRSSVDFTINAISSAFKVGGLVGLQQGYDISDSWSTGGVEIRSAPGPGSQCMYVGGLVGETDQTVRDCWSSSEVNVTGPSDIQRVGGLVGIFYYGTMSGCHSSGKLTVEPSQLQANAVGGLIGENRGGSIDRCYSANRVIVRGSCDASEIGGLVGNSSGNVQTCNATGRISVDITPRSAGISRIGGLVGRNSHNIRTCLSECLITFGFKGVTPSSKKVTAAGGLVGFNDNEALVQNSRSHTSLGPARTGLTYTIDRTGGSVGDNRGTVDSSYSRGYLSLNETKYATSIGGLNGWSRSNVVNCYSVIDIFMTLVLGGKDIGGLIGNSTGTVSYCYSVVSRSGGSAISVGGFAGMNTGTIRDSFFNSEVHTGPGVVTGNSSGVYGNPTLLMKQKKTFTDRNWDFAGPDRSGKWGIIEDRTYPFLYGIYYAPIISLIMDPFAVEDRTYLIDYSIVISAYPSINRIEKVKLLTNAYWLTHSQAKRTISGTPTNDHIRWYWLNLTVEDLVGETPWTNFTFKVINVNDPPKIVTENILEAMEDVPYSRYYYAVDEDPPPTALTWNMVTDAKWLFFEGNHLYGTPLNYDIGEFWVNVSVWDLEYGMDFTNFSVIVHSENDPPVITLEPIPIAFEDDEYRLNLTAIDVDEGDHLTWSITSAPGWLLMTWTHLVGTPGNDDVGKSWVSLKVEDIEGASDEIGFILEVKNVNDPPIWIEVPTDQNITEGNIVVLNAVASDVDVGDRLTYDIMSDPSSNITVHPATGAIKWVGPTPGNYSVNVTSDDGTVQIVHRFNITVNTKPTIETPVKVNHPPSIGAVEDREIVSGKTLYINLTATDEDDDELTFRVEEGPRGLVISVDGNLVWTPTEDYIGKHTVKVMVSDGNLSNTTSLNVTVLPPPEVDGDDDEEDGDDTVFISAIAGLIVLCLVLVLLLVLSLVLGRKGRGEKAGDGPVVGSGEAPSVEE